MRVHIDVDLSDIGNDVFYDFSELSLRNVFCHREKKIFFFWHMEAQHGRLVDEKNVIQFFSNAKPPLNMLSNFFETEVVLDGKVYPSTEHAFQAQLSLHPEVFTLTSEIGKLTPEACHFVGFPESKMHAKCEFWSKKKNVGILAKMLISKHDKLGLKRRATREECEHLFKKILLEKFRKNSTARKVLLDTKDAYLYEFVRSSNKRFQKNGEIERWGAMIVDGKVVGDNQMGALMMWVREELLAKP